MQDRLLQFFEYAHLPPHLQAVSKPFHDLAHAIVKGDNVPESGTVTIGPPLPSNPERTGRTQGVTACEVVVPG